METLFRAVAGFATALILLNGQAAWLRDPAILAVKAEIASAQPGARLGSALGGFLAPRDGTAQAAGSAPWRARHLHS